MAVHPCNPNTEVTLSDTCCLKAVRLRAQEKTPDDFLWPPHVHACAYMPHTCIHHACTEDMEVGRLSSKMPRERLNLNGVQF